MKLSRAISVLFALVFLGTCAGVAEQALPNASRAHVYDRAVSRDDLLQRSRAVRGAWDSIHLLRGDKLMGEGRGC